MWWGLYRLVRSARIGLTRIEAALAKQFAQRPQALERLAQDASVRATRQHNMAADPDESFYLRQYLFWLDQVIEARRYDWQGARVLDLGCGSGRLTLPLAERFAPAGVKEIVGLDVSGPAVAQAEAAAWQAGFQEVITFIVSDALDFLRSSPSGRFQFIACIELLYGLPRYKEILSELGRVITPGGLLFITFRPKYYNLLRMLFQRDAEGFNTVLSGEAGPIYGPSPFNWQTPQEAKRLLDQSGFKAGNVWAIGACSGIPGDPMASIAQPSRLSPEERNTLIDAEIKLAVEMPEAGRYFLIEAIRSGG